MRRHHLALLGLVACASPEDEGDGDDGAPVFEEPTEAWLSSDGTRLRDAADRVVILRGVNARVEGIFDVTFDDGREALEPVPTFGVEDARRMRALGFNVLRLPVNWSGIEPQRDVFDEAYLDRVQTVVDLCAAEGIWTLIDFHQDAYSKEIGEDGAPLWAIDPPPTELMEGPLTEEALEDARTSAQVLFAFQTFFDDTDENLKDQELQAEFADMAAHVAERFVDEPWVLGYELFNEPVAMDPFVWTFHERITAAIREVDAQHMLFFEPNSLRNFTDNAPLSPTPFGDDQGVYAPHLYTLVFGDPDGELETLTKERLVPNVEAALAEAGSWQTPLFIGEWGIGPTAPNADLYLRWLYELFDEHALSSTTWLWKEMSQGRWGFFDYDDATGTWTERPDVIQNHSRIYPQAIGGEPSSISFDVDTGAFELRFAGRADGATTQLFVPEAPYYPATFEVSCDGEVVATQAERDGGTGRVAVTCNGEGDHTIAVAPSG